jgi:hypothetical protein
MPEQPTELTLEQERDRLAAVIRDWIHEQPFSECNMGADTCPDWPLTYELTDRILVGVGIRI